MFIKDDALRKMNESQRIEVWDFMQLFFPDNTNKIQFECAHSFMRLLLKEKSIQSDNIKQHFTINNYHSLANIVLPKLERFGLVNIIGQRGKGKIYRIELSKKFSDRIHHLSIEWFRIYTKYGDTYGG